MGQLVMRWYREKHPEMPEKPDWGDFVCRGYDGSAKDVEMWNDIIADSFESEKGDEGTLNAIMNGHGRFENDKFLIVEKDGEGVATLAVIPHWDKSEGYIHMVGCKEKYRGLGIGTKMNAEAVRILIENGFETAYLTTDDWRIPAIKSYLRAGFEPEMTDPDHPERWEKIFAVIGR